MKIVILGGGISSLSAAYYARKRYPDADIRLFEQSAKLGGWMQTSREGGVFFEEGPRTFAAGRCANLLALIEELGLLGEKIESDPAARRRYLWYQGKLRELSSFLPMMIWPLLTEPFRAKGSGEDESIFDFAARRLGTKIANTLIDAMGLGIYAGDIHKLSVRSCFPFLVDWEEKRGSLVLGALFAKKKKGPKGLFTLKNGMGMLIEKLAEKSQADIRLHAPVEEIRKDGVIAGGAFYPADLIVSGLNGSSIGRLTGLWDDFEESSLSVAHLAFGGDVLPKKGFGYLIPTIEKENLMGMVWDSAVFPQQSASGETRVTAMMRKGGIPEALDAARRHLGIAAFPSYSKAHRLENAIPQFHVGYGKRLARFQEEAAKQFPLLCLAGNYIRGASVDACIAVSKNIFAYPD